MKSVFVDFERSKYPYSGLGNFSISLAAAFAHIAPEDLDMTLLLEKSQIEALPNSLKYLPYRSIFKYLSVPGNYDVWHMTHQDSYFEPKNKKIKCIYTIHDLNYLFQYSGRKQELYRKKIKKRIERADIITFISKYTENLVRENFDLQGKETKIVYNGYSIPKTPTDLPHQGKPYFFSIGVLHPKKNFASLIPLMKYFPEHELIIAGKNNTVYAEELRKLAQSMGLEKRIILMGTVDEQTKSNLYKHCDAFLFPSLAEGFGIPLVEAMSFGKAVFISDKGSLPEIAAGQAYIWDNFEAEKMYQRMKIGLEEYNSDSIKKVKIIERSREFSYKKAAIEYLELYRTL
jgi:glycosyltransferase involved in cell wall biosynthesis